MTILYVGSGAVNLALAGWMHSGTRQTLFLVRSANHELIRTKTFQCRLPGDVNTRVYTCAAYSSLEGVEKPDLVIFGVKSYALDGVVQQVLTAFGPDIPVLSVLNGVRHVELLTEKFKTPNFCTIGFNAYRTSPIVSIATDGVVVLSSAMNKTPIMQFLHSTLKKKISVVLANNPMDVAHCKLIVNLGNALLTLVAFHDNRRYQLVELQKLTAVLIWEGVQVMKKSGVKEARISGIPTWFVFWLNKMLPSFITVPVFERKMRLWSINSMAQDLKNGSATTELEDINGYFLKLAERVGVQVPVNKAIYTIFKEWKENGSQPFTPERLTEKVNSLSNL